MAQDPRPEAAYEDRLVVFLDLLGWTSVINQTNSRPTLLNPEILQLSTLRSLVDWVRQLEARDPNGTPQARASLVSDTIVFSFEPNDPVRTATLLPMLQQVVSAILMFGRYTRGCITYGPLFHQGEMVFGPALLDAADIEKNVAKYPRVVITPQAAPFIRKVEELGSVSLIRTDRDGIMFLDTLGWCPDGMLRKLRVASEQWREQDRGNLNHYAKHCWMLAYIADLDQERAAARARTVP